MVAVAVIVVDVVVVVDAKTAVVEAKAEPAGDSSFLITPSRKGKASPTAFPPPPPPSVASFDCKATAIGGVSNKS